MFKSKGFTITFIILALIIVLLNGVIFYLLLGKGAGIINNSDKKETGTGMTEFHTETVSASTTASPDTTNEETEEETDLTISEETKEETKESTEEETTEEETTEEETDKDDGLLRALYPEEKHIYPIVNEEIEEHGELSILSDIEEEGLVFHKKPIFDDPDSTGNLINHTGAYDIKSKIFIIDDDKPYLMYKTLDNYYVTSNKQFISYTPYFKTKTDANKQVTGVYGTDESEGAVVIIHASDGNHIAFSIMNYDADLKTQSPALVNVIGAFSSDGNAYFEFHNTDGKTYKGSLEFKAAADFMLYTLQVTVKFNTEVKLEYTTLSEIKVHN